MDARVRAYVPAIYVFDVDGFQDVDGVPASDLIGRDKALCSQKNHLRDGRHITSARSWVLLASEPLTGAETTRRLAHSINRSQATNRRNYPMKTTQELKTETLQVADTYRAPRLVALGSAVGLVQAGILGEALDAGSNPYANRVQIPRR
jgi:hypothetical protein